ncbi:hypothetical protein S83_008245, partial [Arachis hypogaea]
FVLEKGASYDPLKPNDQRWGVVRCVDALEHTVKLGDQAGKNNGKPVTDLKAEASLEDGNQVHCVDEFPDNPFMCCVGNVTGSKMVAPYKVFRIEKHEGSSVISIPQETNVDELPQEMIEHRSLPSDKKEKVYSLPNASMQLSNSKLNVMFDEQDLLNSDGVRENCEKQFGECSSFSLPRAAFELFSSIKASIFQTLGATPLSGAVSSVPTYEEENRSDFPNNKDLKTCNQCTHSHQVDKLQFIEEITPNPEVVKTHEHNNFLFLVYRSFNLYFAELLFPKPIVYPSLNPSSRQKLCSLATAANGCVADALACCSPVAHYLQGLLPPTVILQDTQVKKMIQHVRQYQVPLQKHMAMMDLQERNERLFYKLLIEDVEELLPVVYAPTVGEACHKYESIFMHPQGLYISLKEKGRILEVLRNWPEKNIQFIVVTDGERILGLRDLGCQGMGIPVGKLSLYTALGGVRPSACLPITIDVGTNNENLLNDELYIGLKQRRVTGQEYAELMHEFMSAVKQNYGEKVFIQFEDFANHNAFDLLEKYRSTHLVFNDDIQIRNTSHQYLIPILWLALELQNLLHLKHQNRFIKKLPFLLQTNAPLDEVHKNIWLVDSKGLIVGSRKESLQHFKKPWAHDHEPVHRLVDAINKSKPTVLIGTSGQGRTFTKEVIEAMTSINEKPIILSLSNPSSQLECTAEEAYKWSQ